MGAISVLGSANMDLVFHQPRRPEPGETIVGSRFAIGPGGKGLNQAVAASRAGADVRMISAIGSDDFGTQLHAWLTFEGIDTTFVRRVAESTGVAQISLTADGENTIVIIPGANDSAVLSDDDRAIIDSTSHLVVQLERPKALLQKAMSFARTRGITTVLTPAPVRGDIDELIDLSDILVPNEGEALMLSGESDADAAARVLSARGPLTIVTLGPRGALVAEHGKILYSVPAPQVEPVDTTAAGDTFVGYLVAALAIDTPLRLAVEVATVAASLSVTRLGAAESIPHAADVKV
ncbi:ribokinase [Microbacterium saperdae]|nr:ribokinase [Microbacterium saperdae]